MEYSIPWIEKYRPKEIDDIILDEYVERQIKICLEDRDNVHLIINGFPGIGKTSTVRCIAKKILGENLKDGYLELNSADDRGISSISNVIPKFCKKINFTGTKVILFDEADNMTIKCQNDINNMIKLYGQKTKFIFTCNDSTKISEDLQSVCRIIRFKPLNNEQITTYLTKICDAEKIEYHKNGFEMICYIANGDMRKAINNLQLTAFSFNKITKNNVLKICKVPDPEDIKNIIKFCLDKNLIEANNNLNKIINDGYYYLDIVNAFSFVLISDETIPNNQKIKLLNNVNQTKIIISGGLRSNIQIVAMLCQMIKN